MCVALLFCNSVLECHFASVNFIFCFARVVLQVCFTTDVTAKHVLTDVTAQEVLADAEAFEISLNRREAQEVLRDEKHKKS